MVRMYYEENYQYFFGGTLFFLLHVIFSVFIATLLMDIFDLAAAKRWYLEPERVMLLTRTHPCFRGCSVKPTEGTVFSNGDTL